MIRYSVQLRDRRFVKGYGILPFAKNMGRNISKNLLGQYNQKVIHHAKQSASDAFKTASKKSIQKTAKATGDVIGNKIAD